MSRNINNTAYKVQVDILNSESGVSVEQGSLHVFNNKLKVHLDEEIKEIIILPQPPAEGMFFLQSNDGVLSWEAIVVGGGEG